MLSAFCENHGIIHEVTSPYCVAERKDRTLEYGKCDVNKF